MFRKRRKQCFLGTEASFNIWLIQCLTSEVDTVEVVTCDSVL